MWKKWLTMLLSAVLLVGCAAGTKKEELTNLSSIYTELKEENVYTIGNQDSVKRLLEHGTGILFFGFPECPWCQAYVPMLEEAVETANTSVLYYNIYTDKTEDAAYYDAIAEYINSQDETILSYNNEGRLVIYMPLVLFIQEGKIIAWDNETCTQDSKEISPQEYWTSEKKSALQEKLQPLVLKIAEAQVANDSQGCSLECGENTGE